MLHRSLSNALRLQCRVRGFATGAHHAVRGDYTLRTSGGDAAGDAFDGFSTFAAIRGAPSVPFGGCTHDLGLSAGQQGQPASAQYMQRAVNITGEHILVARLAAVWQIPPEILQANVRALASLLQPCGRDTSAHALWAMVRCPELRHADEQELRISFRQLMQMVQHLDLDKPTLLAAVYRRPWMLRAAKAAALRARAAAARAPNASRSGSSSSNYAGSSDTRNADSSSGNEDSSSSNSSSSCGSSRYMAPWNHELALLLLEIHASSTLKSNNSSTASPALALTAVRSYLAAAEAVRRLGSTVNSVLAALAPSYVLRSPFTTSPVPSQAKAVAAAAAATALPSAVGHSFRSSSSLAKHQSQQQNDHHLELLMQLCPPLTHLPPEVLLCRWQLLLSGLLGSPQSAAALLMTNPYIVVNYADFEREDCPYEVEGF